MGETETVLGLKSPFQSIDWLLFVTFGVRKDLKFKSFGEFSAFSSIFVGFSVFNFTLFAILLQHLFLSLNFAHSKLSQATCVEHDTLRAFNWMSPKS